MDDLIFALDIGTRTVVGVVGMMVDEMFHVVDCEVVPHAKRSMMDGQIEDIDEVAKIVEKAKRALEERQNMKFTNVAIAAAGRALKTECVNIELEIPTDEPISEQLAESFEMEAISTAQQRIDSVQEEAESISFYCVGYNIIGYELDGYKMKSIKGHRGKKIQVEVIAAFLPSMVVESLYSVMERNELEVSALTLEPIAAMNVIVPPEVRLINIALVDIGAGTSDIAIAQNGSIVAYAMATTAGDEITEEIIKHYLVDFETAERMKITAGSEDLTYRDILGFEYTITSEEFYTTISPSIDALADTITQTITNINGGAPAAVFLVGGGSLLPNLPKLVSEKLGIAESRIAVSGSNYIKSVVVTEDSLKGPAYVTPIGIGVTSVIDSGYDFSNVFLNGKKFKVFDTKNLKVFDVLLMGGYKTKEILGRSGTDLVYTLNGKEVIRRGEVGKPAELTLNGNATTLNSFVKKWDKIEITPAVAGEAPKVKLFDLMKQIEPIIVTLDEREYSFEPTASVNGEMKDFDYQIEVGDVVEIKDKFYLSDLEEKLESISDEIVRFAKGGILLEQEYVLGNSDMLTTIGQAENILQEIEENLEEVEKEEVYLEQLEQSEKLKQSKQKIVNYGTPAIQVYLNGEAITLPQKEDNSAHILLESLNFIELDPENPVALDSMAINGQTAEFISVVHEGDRIEITFTS